GEQQAELALCLGRTGQRGAFVPVGGAQAVRREAGLGRGCQRIVEGRELELGYGIAHLRGATEDQEGGAEVARLGKVAGLGQHRFGRGLGRQVFAHPVAHRFVGGVSRDRRGGQRRSGNG